MGPPLVQLIRQGTQKQECQMNKAAHIALGLIFLATLGLSGCGVKGQLKRPANAPKAEPAGPDGKKPHRSFILDGVL